MAVLTKNQIKTNYGYGQKPNDFDDFVDTVTDATVLGIENVDNTSDANKPVSTATQTALNKKQVVIQFVDLAALNAAIAANPGWVTGQELRVLTEPAGFTRIWNGTNALTVALPSGNTITLAASTNTIISTSGAPSEGNNGDYAWNKIKSLLTGPKSTTYPSGVSIVRPFGISNKKLKIVRKLLSSIAACKAGNPIINPPMGLPPDWQQNHIYKTYMFVKNNGNVYIAKTDGTSAGSGGPSISTFGEEVDNTVRWTFICKAYRSADHLLAPTFAINESKTGFTTVYNCVTGGVVDQTWCKFTGGIPAIYNTNRVALQQTDYRDPNNSNPTAGNLGDGYYGYFIDHWFWTDADKFGIDYNHAGYPKLPISMTIYNNEFPNGVFHNINPLAYDTTYSDPAGIMVDLKTPGPKLIRLRYSATVFAHRIYIKPPYTCWSPDFSQEVSFLHWGDSIPATSTLQGSIGQHIADMMGIKDFRLSALGGTGLIQNLSNAYKNYLQRIADFNAMVPDVLFFSFPGNDSWNTTPGDPQNVDACKAALFTFLDNAYSKNPDIIIFLTGAQSPLKSSTPNSQTREILYKGVVDEYKASRNSDLIFIPCASDITPWVTGDGSSASPSGTGNADWYSYDGTHPSVPGCRYWAFRHINVIEQALSKLLIA